MKRTRTLMTAALAAAVLVAGPNGEAVQAPVTAASPSVAAAVTVEPADARRLSPKQRAAAKRRAAIAAKRRAAAAAEAKRRADAAAAEAKRRAAEAAKRPAPAQNPLKDMPTDPVNVPGLAPMPTDSHAGSHSGPYTFMVENADGSPARWNGCATITYRLNLKGAPAGAKSEVEEAFRRISRATGLKFVYGGTTTLVPGRDDAPMSGAVIAWARSSDTPFLAGGASGSAGPSYVAPSDQGPQVILSGAAVFNVEHNSLYRPGFGPGLTRGNLLLHELGHMVGLSHVESEKQLMAPYISSVTPNGYASGDLAGLKRLGASAGPCLTY